MTLINTEELRTPRSLIAVFNKATNRKLVLVANTSAQVVSTNLDRAYLVVVNNSDDAVTLAFGDGAAALNQGIVLTAKGSSFELTQLNLFTGRIAAISGSASELSIIECSF